MCTEDKILKENKIYQKQKEVEKKLKKYSGLQENKLFKELHSSIDGLSVVEIDELLEKYGPNTIEIEKNNSFLKKVIDAIINPFNIVLILLRLLQMLLLRLKKTMLLLF